MKKLILGVVILLSIISMFANEFAISEATKLSNKRLLWQLLDENDKFDSEKNLTCLLIIKSDIKNIFFTNSYYLERQSEQDGEYHIILRNGASYIKIIKDGFTSKKYTFPVNLKGRNVYEMTLSQKIPDIVMIPSIFKSNIPNSEIYIDGKSFGFMGNNGLLKKDLASGDHDVMIVKAGFVTLHKKINISNENKRFDFTLKIAHDLEVTIQSNPSGAEVFLDDIYFGTTPVTKIYLEGTYSIKLFKSDYEVMASSIVFSEDKENSISYELNKIGALLTIRTYPNATIYLNNDKGHKGGIENYKIAPQTLDIKVTMPKAKTNKQTITLDAKDVIYKEIYPTIYTGTIKINTIPEKTIITLTDHEGGEFMAIGSHVFENIPIGDYEIKLTYEGYKTQKEIVKLCKSKRVQKDYSLKIGKDYFYDFAFVEGGTFDMGSDSPDADFDEKPVHKVTISDFYISKHEVTTEQYRYTMYGEETLSEKEKPVKYIDWYSAVNFCNKLSEKEGLEKCYTINGEDDVSCDFSKKGYRLPTEAEWEYAARGGNKTKGYKYSGSDNIDDVAHCSGIYEDIYKPGSKENNKIRIYSFCHGGSPRNVGLDSPNELGIYDMSGNVYEWCWDWYGDYSAKSQVNPKGPSNGSKRVLRGGSFDSYDYACRPSFRYSYYKSGVFSNLVGFRLARTK